MLISVSEVWSIIERAYTHEIGVVLLSCAAYASQRLGQAYCPRIVAVRWQPILLPFPTSDAPSHSTMTKQSAGRCCVTLSQQCSVLLCGERLCAMMLQLCAHFGPRWRCPNARKYSPHQIWPVLLLRCRAALWRNILSQVNACA